MQNDCRLTINVYTPKLEKYAEFLLVKLYGERGISPNGLTRIYGTCKDLLLAPNTQII